jgi:hypothetical protein
MVLLKDLPPAQKTERLDYGTSMITQWNRGFWPKGPEVLFVAVIPKKYSFPAGKMAKSECF